MPWSIARSEKGNRLRQLQGRHSTWYSLGFGSRFYVWSLSKLVFSHNLVVGAIAILGFWHGETSFIRIGVPKTCDFRKCWKFHLVRRFSISQTEVGIMNVVLFHSSSNLTYTAHMTLWISNNNKKFLSFCAIRHIIVSCLEVASHTRDRCKNFRKEDWKCQIFLNSSKLSGNTCKSSQCWIHLSGTQNR